jgi:hypothetical protein
MLNYLSVYILRISCQIFSHTITFEEQVKLPKLLNLEVLIIYNNPAES